jgi:transcriptional regulator with XRE-family HTH domain
VSTGEKLRRWRRQLGISQGDLARAAGLNPKTLWLTEHEKRPPTWRTLSLLATALSRLSGRQVEPAALSGESSSGTDSGPIQAGGADHPTK